MALVFPDSLALKRHGAAGPEPSVRHADSESLADWATAILIAPRRVFMKPRRVRILPWAWLALAGVANLGWLIAIGWATVAFALWLFD